MSHICCIIHQKELLRPFFRLKISLPSNIKIKIPMVINQANIIHIKFNKNIIVKGNDWQEFIMIIKSECFTVFGLRQFL